MNIFRVARIEAGLSQGDVAKKLGYTTPQFVSNWERNLADPPPSTIKKLAKIYGRPSLEEHYIDFAVKKYREELLEKMRKATKAASITP